MKPLISQGGLCLFCLLFPTIALVVVGCGTTALLVPTITGLSPAAALAGGPAFTLTVTGTNFSSGSTVQWNGSSRTTTFVSSTQLTAAILDTDIAAGGLVPVTILNSPSGSTSLPATFTVDNPAPQITSISPTGAASGGAAFTLTVNGTGFVATSVVQFSGSARVTTFVNSTQLTAAILATDIAIEGSPAVTVFNAAPGGGTSSGAAFAVVNPQGVLERVSVSSAGAEGNSTVFEAPAISADGRYVAFTSSSSNLVANDTNGFADVFLRDTCRGAPAGCTPSTIFVSVATDGTQGDANSGSAVHTTTPDNFTTIAISADGRFVGFTSRATNLVANDTNNAADVFVRDTCTNAPAGCTPGTTRVSVATDGTQGDGDSTTRAFGSFLSADGRYVTFESRATNLVANDTNGVQDVFVRDTCFGAPAGCVPSTTRVGLANDGSEPNGGGAGLSSISADGRYVAFASVATNLVTGDTNGQQDAFVRDTCVGAPAGCTPSTIRVSVASDGTEGNNFSGVPSITADGRYVVFYSLASNLVAGDTNGAEDTFLRDTCAGAAAGCTPSTTLVSVATDGSPGNGDSFFSILSADGRFIAFASTASNLVAGDTNGVQDIFVRDTCIGAPAGCAPQTKLASVALDGTPENAAANTSPPALSGDGRFVAFPSDASNLVAGDTNGQTDIFLAATGFIEGSPVPVLSQLSPSNATSGGGDIRVIATGSSFVPGSVVSWNGAARPTYFLGSGRLMFVVRAADIAAAGTASVTVVNPSPGGGASSSLTFTIQ